MTNRSIKPLNRWPALLSSFSFLIITAGPICAQVPGALDEARGIRINSERASPGYVLFSPANSGRTYLIDNEGQAINMWQSDHGTGHSVYMRENGNVVRAGRIADHTNHAGGQGGQLQEWNWEGELVWNYRLANDEYYQHHDIELLPNGNVLAVVWEYKSAEQARDAGRRPDVLTDVGLWPETILELEPQGVDDARIVWTWNIWDHLIQDFDPESANYGVVAEHPELVDINSDAKSVSEEQLEELRTSSEIAQLDTEENRTAPDFIHFNSMSYNPELDQIVVSSNTFGEFWVIDHSTSTEEAAGSTGGKSGKGGDILYRWGRASNYDRGGERPQTLYNQHHVHWIAEGLPGAGNISLFMNNFPGPRGRQSVAVELVPPMDDQGRYVIEDAEQFGPEFPAWIYMANDGPSFHSPFISSAHRLPNGHTFIASGAQGRFFEVTPKGEIVWEYWNPYAGEPELPFHDVLMETNAPNFYMAFRATKILPNHPGLAGKNLDLMNPQPSWVPHPPQE